MKRSALLLHHCWSVRIAIGDCWPRGFNVSTMCLLLHLRFTAIVNRVADKRAVVVVHNAALGDGCNASATCTRRHCCTANQRLYISA